MFFEEAQRLENAGLFLKGLVDARMARTLVVTGSASFHLMARTRESLAGHATRHRVWPLSLSEVIAGATLFLAISNLSNVGWTLESSSRTGSSRNSIIHSPSRVGFVVEPRPGEIVPIEVKASRDKIRLTRSARSFIDTYAPPRFLFVHRGAPQRQTVGSTLVEAVPA